MVAGRIMKDRDRLPREAMESLSLEVLKTWLYKALNKLV